MSGSTLIWANPRQRILRKSNGTHGKRTECAHSRSKRGSEGEGRVRGGRFQSYGSLQRCQPPRHLGGYKNELRDGSWNLPGNLSPKTAELIVVNEVEHEKHLHVRTEAYHADIPNDGPWIRDDDGHLGGDDQNDSNDSPESDRETGKFRNQYKFGKQDEGQQGNARQQAGSRNASNYSIEAQTYKGD
jgi:hypothetical protein